ncbi:MAG TPA: fumarylacetoacetate hydrolase family protein [Solirubrobacteraceae bacterium]|jgi:2-keto-4-pentenoate hydratase/2-oxohepta-3-ene-1,7-dioic acid hydratase in catechol pathway|nr:fumarylacetoacetate hydrolase family protein [Solirubrobacteraceae bacterium]
MWALGTFARADAPPAGDRPFPGLVLDGEVVIDLAGYGWETTRDVLRGWSRSVEVLDHLAADVDAVGAIGLGQLTVLPPIRPEQVLQSGANYRRHVIDIIVAEARERGEMSEAQAREHGVRVMDERVATGEPYVFLGAVSAICGPYDDVVLPTRGDQHDWELELAVVIGHGGRHIPEASALEHVAGYTIANDLTTRDLVYRRDLEAIGTDWLRAKNAPTFLPLGPWIVPARFVSDPQDLTITLSVDGTVMQDESTSDMIFNVATLVSYASTLVTLGPGDVVLTGSPAGNGMHHRRFLTDGDVMEGVITGLGAQRNRCVREGRRP